MLEKIKTVVFQKYQPTEKKGVFLSAFNEQGTMLNSNGVMTTNEPLLAVIDKIYSAIIVAFEKNLKLITIDIINQITELTNNNDILNSSPKNFGFILMSADGKNSGIILPNTEGVADAKNAFGLIKNKYKLEGKVKIYRFTTDRIIVVK